MKKYSVPIPRSRGFQPSYSISSEQPPTVQSLDANDVFLHLLFGRIASRNNTTHEMVAAFDSVNQVLELDVPNNLLDVITTIQKGPNLTAFIDWLINTNVTVGTYDQLSSSNLVYGLNVFTFDTTNSQIRIGNGVSNWLDLEVVEMGVTDVDVNRNVDASVLNIVYVGTAPLDSDESDEVWKIVKTNYADESHIFSLTALDVSWTDRYSAIYS